MIELKNICKSFERPGESRLDVLQDVDLRIEDGEFLAIVGASGSGKTTLMNIIGLLDEPDGGDYALNGEQISGMNSDQLAGVRNSKIGFVFQQFHLLPRTTATENVELPLIYSDADNVSELAQKALARVGLEDRESHYPNQLSGGQQQRVAIARALVTNPDLILADEPTGNLDKDATASIMELFRALNQDGRTIVLVTHDTELAQQATRRVRIQDGRLEDITSQ